MGSSLREGDSNQLAVHRWEEPGPTGPGSSFSERFPPQFYVRRVAATAHFSRSSRAAAISLSRRRIAGGSLGESYSAWAGLPRDCYFLVIFQPDA